MSEWTNHTMRELERSSIREFVKNHAHLFEGGKVLDFGCGKELYRDIVESNGGAYTGYDRMELPGSTVSTDVGPDMPLVDYWDVILCTQVIQYIERPYVWIAAMHRALNENGCLVLTGPTNWPEVESEDLFRYTMAGISHLLEQDFAHVNVYSRATIKVNDIFFSLGWGAVAWK